MAAAAKGKNQVVLKEIMEFAEYLGMDPVEDGDLLWIAEQARNAPLPAPWSEHQDEGGNTYYYNSATDDSVWEHPLDEYYRNLYRKHKDEKDEQGAREEAYAKEAELAGIRQGEKAEAKKARAEKRLKKKSKAATSIQAVWRGKVGRRKMNSEIEKHAEVTFWAASKLQAVFRAKMARRRAHEQKLEKYATKIQARFRGRRLRRMVIQNVSELVAAITVQRLWRGKQIRREFLRKRDEIGQQLDWETENAAASRIQSIYRFKLEMRRKKQQAQLEKIFGNRALGFSPRTNAVITIQRAAKDHWKWRPEVSDAMKFQMFQAMEREKFDNKLGKLKAKAAQASGELMAHDMGVAAENAGKRGDAKRTKVELIEQARVDAEAAKNESDPKVIKAKARAEKRQKKMQARQELMMRMQSAAAVMVQRAFRRRMFRKRMRLLSRRTHVAAAKIQLAWRWHLSRQKKKEKQYIVKRLSILMDSLTNSLAEREKEVTERDAACYIQTMWRGYMSRELLNVMKTEHDAACAMQRAVRGWLLRMWLKRSRAAIRIQSAFRGFRVRVRIARAKARDRARREREREIRDRRRKREERKKYEVQIKKEQESKAKVEKEKQSKVEATRKMKAAEALKIRSAIQVQKVFRGFLTRSIVFPLLLEQRRLNAEADRIRLHQRMDAALTMQSFARGWKSRRNMRRQLASIKIQAVWRGFLCRTGPYLREFSAREIQRHFRGHYTRNYLAAYLETQALSDAATRIQTKFRAFAVKRRVSRWEMMAGTVQSAFRGYLAREYVRKKRVDVYATKLQSVFRGWQGRQAMKHLKGNREDQAAASIQAMWRGRQCRQAILRDMYHWCSAFQIQRWFRKRMRRRHRAATAIQGMWRGNRAKVEIGRRRKRKGAIIELRGQRREAAIRMQRWFRVHHIKRLPQHNAATRIQAVWRGILGRKIVARERFLFEQKYGNYKEFMLDMYSQIESSAPGEGGEGEPGGGGGPRGGGKKKKGQKKETRAQLLAEEANPFKMDATALEDDMGVKLIWLKFDKETANNMAQYFYRRNKPLAALQYIEKSLWQDQRLKQRDFVAKTCLHFSNVLAKLARHEEALKLAEQSLILFQAEQQLRKQEAAELGEEFNEPMVKADPKADKKRSGKGGKPGQEEVEDEVADTIQAALAICYHNISVQQLCCNLVTEASESSAQALTVGKKCIEEWHPWVKQMETTHLACIKLGGGFPDMGGPEMEDQSAAGGSASRRQRGGSRSPPPIQDRTNRNSARHQGGGSAVERSGGGRGGGRGGGGGKPRGRGRGGGSGRRGGGDQRGLPQLNPYNQPQAPVEPRRRRVLSAEGKRNNNSSNNNNRRRSPPRQGAGGESDRSLPDLRRQNQVGSSADALQMHGPDRPHPGSIRSHSARDAYDDEEGYYDDEEDYNQGGDDARDAWASGDVGRDDAPQSVRVVDWPVSPEPSLHEEDEAAPYDQASRRRGGGGSRHKHRSPRAEDYVGAPEAENFDGNSQWSSVLET